MATSPASRAVGDIVEHVRSDIAALPPLSDTVIRVLELTRDPDVSANQLVEVINRDQALVANVLRLCNSAYYGLPRVVSSLRQGLIYLGFCTVRTLVLTSGVKGHLDRSLPAYGYKRGELWKHGVAVAVASRRLWYVRHSGNEDVAYTAGLLHDVGKIVLAQYLSPQLEDVMRLVHQDNVPFSQAEARVLGIDHAELGGDIASAWNFPLSLVNSIRHHHEPERCTQDGILGKVVHVADAVAVELGYGFGRNEIYQPASAEVLAELGLDEHNLSEFKNTVQAEIQSVAELLF